MGRNVVLDEDFLLPSHTGVSGSVFWNPASTVNDNSSPGSLMQPMRVTEVSMEKYRNEGAGKTGGPRENPPTNGIVRHDSHVRKSGTRPEIKLCSPWWEASGLTARPPRPLLHIGGRFDRRVFKWEFPKLSFKRPRTDTYRTCDKLTEEIKSSVGVGRFPSYLLGENYTKERQKKHRNFFLPRLCSVNILRVH
ncbi:hypothetical protein PR048_016440 [Dryococelus australis]|uniref:Uncharacterized protein n=1 Tax=Dryococelus australis TaxID=614101 RepID=A0ABQ9HJS3_9NEOP|nr:hypothetical protein PR048_016440 [Dryococelus australis]